LDPSTHFVMCNNTRTTIKEGEQILFCYGARPNRALMVNYGFSFPDNKYDSYLVHLKMRIEMTDPFVPEMFDFTFKEDNVQKCRLKTD
jgi:hypothetical protein